MKHVRRSAVRKANPWLRFALVRRVLGSKLTKTALASRPVKVLLGSKFTKFVTRPRVAQVTVVALVAGLLGSVAVSSTQFTVNLPSYLTYDSSAESVGIGPITFSNAPSRVIVTLSVQDTSGNSVAATDSYRIDVDTFASQQSTVGTGTNEVSIDGDRSTEVIVEGTSTDVTRVLRNVVMYRDGSSTITNGANERRVRVAAIEGLDGLVWSPTTQHYYRLATRTTDDGLGNVNANRYYVKWTTARTDAKASTISVNGNTYTGYLAAITTQAEFNFLNDKVSGGSGTLFPAWVGGSDHETEGIWKWVDGPEAASFGGDAGSNTASNAFDGARFWGADSATAAASAPNSVNICTQRGTRGLCSVTETDTGGTSRTNSYYVRWSPGGNNQSRDWDADGTNTAGDGIYSPQPDDYNGNNSTGEDGLIVNWCARNTGIGSTNVTTQSLFGVSGYYCTPGWNDLSYDTWSITGENADSPSRIGTTQYIIEYCGYSNQVACVPPPSAIKNVGFTAGAIPDPNFGSPSELCDIVNSPYRYQFVMINGRGPYSFSLTSGSLPTGLSFDNPNTGVLTGTPTESGSYTFALRATDSTPGTPKVIERTFTLTIQSSECAIATVAMDSTRSVTTASSDFDLSQRVLLPGSWPADQQISVGLSITTTGEDNAETFRGLGGCIIDVSNSVQSDSFGTSQSSPSPTPTMLTGFGGSDSIWIVNDRSPEVTLYGQADLVKQALSRVRVSCDSLSDLTEKYLRLGVVPSETPETIDGTTTNGGLFYVFSTQHYYRYTKATSGLTNTDFRRITELWDYAKTRSITVNGKIRNVPTASQRKGWVATLTNQDEILLTNAIAKSGTFPMIGLTDVGTQTSNPGYSYRGQSDANGKTWAYDSNAWGTPTSTQPDCLTKEDFYRWLGPDAWCQVVPARVNRNDSITFNGTTTTIGNASRYWARSNGSWSLGTSSSFDIDLGVNNTDSSISPYNGAGIFHQWYNVSGPITEPNSSGDYIYVGYGGQFWDDASPSDAFEYVGRNTSSDNRYLIAEFCSPASSSTACAPDASAVASTQFVAVDTSARVGWQIQEATAQASVASSATCTNATFSEVQSGGYRIASFVNNGAGTGTCTWTPPSNVPTVEVMLVGGGGAGGADAGGGGGGGALVIHSSRAISGAATITVGRGGEPATSWTSWSSKKGGNGAASSFADGIGTLSAAGGTGGNGCNFVSSGICYSGGNSNNGGAGGVASGGTINLNGGAGGNGVWQTNNAAPTSGASGNASQSRGVNARYGGGGGGSGASQTPGAGVDGGASGISGTGTPAAARQSVGGGGAGGNQGAGSKGGSGIVVIKYAIPFATNSTDVTIGFTYSGTNSMTSPGTIKRQYATYTSGICGTSWTDDTTSASSFPASESVERTRCYRWTLDPGLVSGAVRPSDSSGFQPTSNLTSPPLIVPVETFVRIPSVLHVDPRATWLALPGLPVAGHPTAMVCLYQTNNSTLSGIGAPMSSPLMYFDLGAIGTAETSSGGATVTGDNTTTLSISGSQDDAQSALGQIRAILSSGRFSSSKYLLLRAVPTITGYTSGCSSSGSQLNADPSGARIVEIKPFGLTFTQDLQINLGRH